MTDYAQTVGKNIAKLRKKHGLTQEQLGAEVGVSGQAVSKWENGGMPDAYLIPEIAKALGVSTDTLFGCKKAVSEREMCEELFRFCLKRTRYKKQPEKFDYYSFLFDAVWSMQCGYFANEKLVSYAELVKDERIAAVPEYTSQAIFNDGTTYLTLCEDFPFFCMVKDNSGISEKIFAENDFAEFFSLFSDEESLKAVLLTQTESDDGKYTDSRMADLLSISLEKFKEICPLLVKYNLLFEEKIVYDDQTVVAYRKYPHPEIRPLLMMAYQFIHARMHYYNFSSQRDKAYFEMPKDKITE